MSWIQQFVIGWLALGVFLAARWCVDDVQGADARLAVSGEWKSQTCQRCHGNGRCWCFAKNCRNCDGDGYVPIAKDWRPYEPCKEER